MNLIRQQALKLVSFQKPPQLRFLKVTTRLLKAKTNFPDFTVYEPKRLNPIAKRPKTAKTDQDLRVHGQKVVAKGFLRQDSRF
jgi:hypothetical protein